MSVKLMSALEQVKTLPDITIGKIVDMMGEESIVVLCLISILPFLQPIPVPGLSTVLGLIAALQGVGFVLFSRPVLTKKLRSIHISHERFELILKAASKVTYVMSKISTLKHPIVKSRFVHIVSGICIIYSALFLSLPLPIPFSNAIPAYSIFFICVALLEEDIALLAVGICISLTAIWMSILSYHLIMEQIENLIFKYLT